MEIGAAKPSDYGTKPLLFIDVDGVINRLPFREVYRGPSECGCEDHSEGCSAELDVENWIVEPVATDVDFYDDFEEDGVVLHPQWRYRLWIGAELMEAIGELESSGAADIVFLSMWRGATSYLNGFMGTRIAYLPVDTGHTEHEVKHKALLEFLRAIEEVRGFTPDFCWIDDVVTKPTENFSSMEEQMAFNYGHYGVSPPERSLIINTALEEGIRRSHWAEVRKFFAI